MPVEVIIVDDDPLVGGLSNDLLTEVGYRTLLIRDSNLVISAVKEHRPRLVILDILMPGIDGLTLLHTIKTDPDLSDVRAVVVSGKTFAAEIDRAKEYGAELFIQKPYDVKQFAEQVGVLIGPPQGGDDGSAPAAADESGEAGGAKAVKFRIWGRSEPDSTPCVSMEALDQLFIMDAGKGIIALGDAILREGKYRKAWMLLSHFHPDHISGLGLFPCLRSEGFELHVLGPKEPNIDLSGVLRDAIKKSFAVNRNPVTAKLKLHQVREDTYEIEPGLRVAPFYANHPSTTLGYLMQLAGRRIAYCPDSEIYGDSATALQDYDEKIGRIVMGCDLLIHDARYKDPDYASHKNEGHSGLSSTVEFAAEHEISRLILFHQDPSYSDAELDVMEKTAVDMLEEKGAVIPCKIGRDGVEISF